LGPIGLFGIGNAKETAHDSRETWLGIEGPDWQLVRGFKPGLGLYVRAFAHAVNVAARVCAEFEGTHAHTEDESNLASRRVDPVERIKQLGALLRDGLITEPEFTEQKQRLLGSL
jgi:hypothetical protein